MKKTEIRKRLISVFFILHNQLHEVHELRLP